MDTLNEVKVSNKDGHVSNSCFVKCRRPDTIQWEESSSLSPYKPDVFVAPEFVEGLTDFTCKEGETIILTVKERVEHFARFEKKNYLRNTEN